MSPINVIDSQRRAREIGRIRLGKRDGTKPVKLSTFRLTSADRTVLERATALYGGAVTPWEHQWQVTTEVAELPVVVPPGQVALSAWYELWSAAGCLRRCDGETCQMPDAQTGQIDEVYCQCEPGKRECRPTTRLSVVLSELPGLGVWRCESHGNAALGEMDSTFALLAMAWSQGVILPGRLRIEQRQSKAPGKARHDFVVPVLDVDVSLADLLLGELPSLGGGTAHALPSAPVPAVGMDEPPAGAECECERGQCLTLANCRRKASTSADRSGVDHESSPGRGSANKG